MTWSQQPVVRVIDASSQTVTTSSAAVTLAIGNNPSGGTLSCASGLTVNAVSGIATFGGCSINNTGPGYTLIATAAGLSAVTSNAFDVALAPPPAPTHLVFAVATVNPPPLTGTAGGALDFVFEIHVADPSGNTIQNGTPSTVPITLSIAPNSVGATVSCPGGLTVVAVAGVAHFTNCSISAAGNGLVLVASSPGMADVSSPPINVGPPLSGITPTIDISASAKTILRGDGVTLSVHVGVVAGGGPVSGRIVHIQTTTVPQAADSWNTIADVTTDASGDGSALYTPPTNRYYRALFAGAPDLGPATSSMVRVTVRQLAAIRPDSAGATKTVGKGATIQFRTTVRPSRDDIPRTHVIWQIWRLVSGRWTLFLSEQSDPDVSGTAFLSITFNTGSWYVRSQAMPTSLNANSVWTPKQRYDVH
jgi:hypothetical protein